MGFSTVPCNEFVEVLGSKAPVPGGGGASALVGAVGTALGNMVGSLTVGKKKYADVEDEMWELKAKCDQLQKDFLRLIERDAEVFEPLSKAYGMPRETEEEKARKTGTEIENVEAEAVEDSLEEEGPAVPFLLMGFPQGFLTGCIMYLSHYSLMIGHWKIALGMAGMWVLLMLNYQAVIIQRKASYPLWKVVGLCLVEGWIIEAAAWFFRSQKVRLYYFIILGVITVCIQVVNLLRLKKEKSQMEEESAHAGR